MIKSRAVIAVHMRVFRTNIYRTYTRPGAHETSPAPKKVLDPTGKWAYTHNIAGPLRPGTTMGVKQMALYDLTTATGNVKYHGEKNVKQADGKYAKEGYVAVYVALTHPSIKGTKTDKVTGDKYKNTLWIRIDEARVLCSPLGDPRVKACKCNAAAFVRHLDKLVKANTSMRTTLGVAEEGDAPTVDAEVRSKFISGDTLPDDETTEA